MIPKECKRLAEVDFPIAVVSKWSVIEKSIRQGHPSTLHLWWARRPLGACRAVLLALLFPDPQDPLCPHEFKKAARNLLPEVQGRPGNKDEHLRAALKKFIGDFSNWDLADQEKYLAVARGLVRAAHGEDAPLVVDPFAGGGSIPVEALRLGCEAFASDLNPVACLINKVMLEDVPRHGLTLAEELRRIGTEIRTKALRELAEFFPNDEDGTQPIAYLWARTVRCEAPNCGAEIPLMRSFWLSKKKNRMQAFRFVIRGEGTKREAVFEIFSPRSETEVPGGTVNRAKATCLCCATVLPSARVRAQLRVQSGGAEVIFDGKGRRTGGALLMAIVTLRNGEVGRKYRISTERDYKPIKLASNRLREFDNVEIAPNLRLVPDEPTPAGGGKGAGRAFSVQKYGMLTMADLFSSRQKLVLGTLLKIIMAYKNDKLRELLAIALDRIADRMSSLCRWDNSKTSEVVKNTFSRQALPIVWDFAESNIFSQSTGNIDSVFEFIANVIESAKLPTTGQVALSDARHSPLPDGSASVWFTDPPYYDAVPYADLSDFFYVWLKRALPKHPLLRDPYTPENTLTPKLQEAVQDEQKFVDGRPKNRSFFEETMAQAFAAGRSVLKEDGIGSVVFAHKTTEGWEALLTGMIRGGWTITGSWPISTEMSTRLRARESAALATSVHLVCRPRPEDAGIGDWHDVLRELPRRVAEWMERLQKEGIRGADLVFACIGPALEIYSKFEKVVDAEDRQIPLGGDPDDKEPYKRGYLTYVWEVVARSALQRVLGTSDPQKNGGTDAIEEDARLSALFLWTLQSTSAGVIEDEAVKEDDEDSSAGDVDDEDGEEEGAPRRAKAGFSLPFDVARRFAQPLGIHLDLWQDRIIDVQKGVVRLLPISERARQLFDEEVAGAFGMAEEVDAQARPQMALPGMEPDPTPMVKGREAKGRSRAGTEPGDAQLRTRHEATTLDRVHAAMLLQKNGRTNALRALLKAEKDRGPNFVRLANSLSALYPPKSEEKRLVDAMLLAMPK